MFLLVNVLEQTEHLASILEGFVKIGVTGTTVLDSVGMGRILVEKGAQVPATEVIREVLAVGRPTNKTIFAVISDKKAVNEAIGVIRSFCGDLNEPGRGILFTFPIEYVEGLVPLH